MPNRPIGRIGLGRICELPYRLEILPPSRTTVPRSCTNIPAEHLYGLQEGVLMVAGKASSWLPQHRSSSACDILCSPRRLGRLHGDTDVSRNTAIVNDWTTGRTIGYQHEIMRRRFIATPQTHRRKMASKLCPQDQKDST